MGSDYSPNSIIERYKLLLGQTSKRDDALVRLAHEFGVNLNLYPSNPSTNEIAEITLRHRNPAIGLEGELNHEAEGLIN